LGPLLAAPRDYLGAWISERKARGWNPGGFYPTPHEVCECMVRMTMHDVDREAKEQGRDPRTYTVCDPCVGTGRMLLHASNSSSCLTGRDFAPLVCIACRITLGLSAPGGVFPLPGATTGPPVPPPPAPLPVPAPPAAPVFRADHLRQLSLFHR